MPDLTIKDSGNCWSFNGGTLCNVVISDKGKEDLPASFLLAGNVKNIKKIHHCWTDEAGNTICAVKAKGKNGGKKINARTIFNHHIEIPNHTIKNNRTPEKCDPDDPNCQIN